MIRVLELRISCACGRVALPFRSFPSGANLERAACINCGRILEANLDALRLMILPHIRIHRGAPPAPVVEEYLDRKPLRRPRRDRGATLIGILWAVLVGASIGMIAGWIRIPQFLAFALGVLAGLGVRRLEEMLEDRRRRLPGSLILDALGGPDSERRPWRRPTTIAAAIDQAQREVAAASKPTGWKTCDLCGLPRPRGAECEPCRRAALEIEAHREAVEESQREAVEDRGDLCLACGAPIDHEDPHVYCSRCSGDPV